MFEPQKIPEPKTFFTSDQHFGHRAIIKYGDRPFESLDQMNWALVEAWNKVVSSRDKVYILGDFSFMNREKTLACLDMLAGQKFIIKGNHDRWKDSSEIASKFVWVKYYHELKVGDKKVVLSHYPFDTWNKAHYGSYHLHGHSHGSLKSVREGRMDVGVDCQYKELSGHVPYAPYSFEEVDTYLKDQDYNNTAVDHHNKIDRPGAAKTKEKQSFWSKLFKQK